MSTKKFKNIINFSIMNKSTFSRNLIRLRKKRGLSQKELAELTGLSQRMIVYYECESGNPPIDKIEKIAKALKAEPNDLLLEKNSNISNKEEFTDINTKTLKRIKQILSLSAEDRHLVYSYVDSLLMKSKEKNKQLQEIKN